MTITFFEYIVKCTQRDLTTTIHWPNGTIETKVIGHAHTLSHLRDTMQEKIDIILHPECFYYPPDYPNGFPTNYL